MLYPLSYGGSATREAYQGRTRGPAWAPTHQGDAGPSADAPAGDGWDRCGVTVIRTSRERSRRSLPAPVAAAAVVGGRRLHRLRRAHGARLPTVTLIATRGAGHGRRYERTDYTAPASGPPSESRRSAARLAGGIADRPDGGADGTPTYVVTAAGTLGRRHVALAAYGPQPRVRRRLGERRRPLATRQRVQHDPPRQPARPLRRRPRAVDDHLGPPLRDAAEPQHELPLQGGRRRRLQPGDRSMNRTHPRAETAESTSAAGAAPCRRVRPTQYSSARRSSAARAMSG